MMVANQFDGHEFAVNHITAPSPRVFRTLVGMTINQHVIGPNPEDRRARCQVRHPTRGGYTGKWGVPDDAGTGEKAARLAEAELRALEQDGILQPRTRLPGARLRWLEADGKALVDELNALAVSEPGEARWETIQKAQANSGISVGRIIAAIRAGKIRVHAQPGNQVYHGFMVCRGEFGAIE